MILKLKRAFTLTEVLIAVAIIGIIAALVLPTIITTYQNKVFEYMESRELQSIKSALDSLVVTENKAKFNETIMYGTASDDTSGKFLKKYFRVAKYCGTSTDGDSECFAPLYYKYDATAHTRTELKRNEIGITGSCAMMKNGVSMCITPQTASASAKVIMDLNGIKGPNVIGRDLIELQNLDRVYSASDISRMTQQGDSSKRVISENEAPITPTSSDECTDYTTDGSTACCQYKKDNNMIAAGDVCCSNTSVGPTVAACNTIVTLHLNYFPTQGTAVGQYPYSKSSGTFRVDPSNAVLPDALGVKIRCGNGSEQGGTLTASSIKSALKSKADVRWPSKVYDKSCYYNQESLLWSANSTKTYTYQGVTYKLEQH